jgi:hypothetical protein
MASPRTAHVRLDDPTFDAFAAFAAAAYPDQPITAAIREACLVLMGTDPMEAAKAAARRAAWIVARGQLAKSFGDAFRKANVDFEALRENSREELRAMLANGEIDPDGMERAA